MKHKLLVASVATSLLLTLYVGFSLGVYYEARFLSVFTANQILIMGAQSTRQKNPQIIAKQADELAARWESHRNNRLLLDSFDLTCAPQLVSLSGETHLLQRNQEIREQLASEASHQ